MNVFHGCKGLTSCVDLGGCVSLLFSLFSLYSLLWQRRTFLNPRKGWLSLRRRM